MPVILQADANPGTAQWVDQNTLSFGGAIQSIQKRVQLADIAVANTTVNVPFDDAVPAGATVIGATLYRTALATGGGVSSCNVSLVNTAVAPLGAFLLNVPILAGNLGFIPAVSSTGALLTGIVAPYLAAMTPEVGVTADVNLDTLATFDVTAFLFYTVPVGFVDPS